MSQLPKRHLAYAALLINAIIWGAAMPVVKPALSYVSPFHFLMLRYLLTLPFVVPLLIFLLIKHRPSLKTLATITLMEILQSTIGLSLLYLGLQHTTSLQAGLLTTTSPIFITLGGIFFLKEKEERHELIGLIIAFTGILLVTLQPLLSGNHQTGSFSSTGNALILTYNLSWTIYILLAKKLYRHVSKPLISAICPLVGFISFSLITPLVVPHQGFHELFAPLTQPPVLLASFYMGVLGTIIAIPALLIGNNLIEASEATLFTYLQPLIYIPLSVFWLKESFTPLMFVAIALITIGVYTAEKRFSPARKKHP